MTSIIFTIGLFSLLVAVVILVFKPYDYGASVQQFKKIGSEDDVKDSSTDTQWRSLKVRPGLISCDSIGKMADQVFLAREAPTLPLENCGEEDCRCHYLFLDDRRSGIDRRLELRKLAGFLATDTEDRRLSPGRRFADFAVG